MNLQDARLYLVCSYQPHDVLDDVLSAGVDVLQLRSKTLDARPHLEIAKRFRAACDRHDAIFIVNDRADLAVAALADGVHLGQDDLPPAVARRIMGRDAIIGRSTHSPAQLGDAASDPNVDYVCTGPVYETPTKPGRPAVGLELVRLAAKECDKPWFAIGGINLDTIEDVAAAGATRIVVVRAITEASDPAKAAAALRAALTVV